MNYCELTAMTKKKPYTFIDLFAGAGGLSEGFIRAGFSPIAHIEMKQDACNTLKTRAAFHYLQNCGQLSVYENYLKNKKEGTDGSALWKQVPSAVTDAAICATIGAETIDNIFEKVDQLKGMDNCELNYTQLKLMEVIMIEPKISIIQLSEELLISVQAVKKNIKTLKDKKIIERIGNNRVGYWKIKK